MRMLSFKGDLLAYDKNRKGTLFNASLGLAVCVRCRNHVHLGGGKEDLLRLHIERHCFGACLRGDYQAALLLQDKLMPLHQNLFIETNPAPAKCALSVLGKCAETVRLPLVMLAEKSKAAVREAMVHAGLIN